MLPIYKPEIQTKPKKPLQLPAEKLQQNENPPINLSPRKPHKTLLSNCWENAIEWQFQISPVSTSQKSKQNPRNHSNYQPGNFNKMKTLSQTEVQEKPTKTLLTNSKKIQDNRSSHISYTLTHKLQENPRKRDFKKNPQKPFF